ncbi:MAG TPA: cyclic nucleotide-binding domain-containing protein, partial [Myxococcota bacterium]
MRLFRSRPRVDVKGLPAEVATRLLKLLDDVERLPQDLRCRRALADCLRGIGRFEEAITHYQALAGAYAAQGLLFRAIAVCKTILEIDPAHVETEATLARLYATHGAQSEQALNVELPAAMGAALVIDETDTRDFVVEPGREFDPLAMHLAREAAARFEAAASVDDMPPIPTSDERSVDDREAIDDAAGVEIDADEILDDDILAELVPKASGSVGLKRPSAVPLFSSLSPSRFTELVKALKCWEAAPGAVIVTEGEPGDSLFVIARGAVVVERRGDNGPVELARMRAGEFFGEIAILAERPRAASVTATKPTELLEIDRKALAALVARDAGVAAIL